MSKPEFATRIQRLDEDSSLATGEVRPKRIESKSKQRSGFRFGVALVALVASGILGYQASDYYRENPELLAGFWSSDAAQDTTTASAEPVLESDENFSNESFETADAAPKKTVTGEFAKQLFIPKRQFRAATYLPPANDGWTRLTTTEVRDWDALEKVKMGWGQQSSAVRWSDLSGLSDFVEAEMSGYHDGHESAALYFKPNGHIIELRVSFLRKSKPGFGSGYKAHKAAQTDTTNAAYSKPIELNGLQFSNATVFDSNRERFNLDTLRRQSFDIHAYLTPNVKISLTGHATVQELEGLLGGLDYDTLNTIEVN